MGAHVYPPILYAADALYFDSAFACAGAGVVSILPGCRGPFL